MDRIAKLAAVTGLMVLVWVDAVPRVSGQAAPADAPHIGGGGVPQFAEEQGWLKLPAKWRLGNTSAVSVDAEGHVWVLHRPRTLPENLRAMAAPPVLEFDQRWQFHPRVGRGLCSAGCVRMAGERARPSRRPERFCVDCWQRDATGRPDPQVHQSRKVRDADREARADGRQHVSLFARRFRSAGASENERAVRLGRIREQPRHGLRRRNRGIQTHVGRVRPQADRSSGHHDWRADLADIADSVRDRRTPATFKTVHDVALSNDDFVYIADRGNKRIQVFTLDGKYVAQQFVGLDSPEYQQARSTAFSPDPQQRFLYVAGSPVIYILNRKTLEMLGEFVIGAAQANPPGHQIAADQRGNLYAPQAAQTGSDGKGGGSTVQKFAFKGVSPRK